MADQKQRLTPQTVQALVKRIKADNALKNRVIETVRTEGFSGTVEKFFEPNEVQKRPLDIYRSFSERIQNLLKEALILALETDGKIEFTNGSFERTSVSVGASGSIGSSGASGSIDIGIECPE